MLKGTSFDTVRYISCSLCPARGASMYDDSEKPHALVCTEVWGGNRKVIRTVKMPSLIAWVASVPLNEGKGGGDLHYMSVCDYDLISRVALADVSGHGSEVDGVTQTLRKLMHKNINAWDQSDFMRGVNEMFGQSGDQKYATAIVLSFHRVMGWLEEGTEAKKVSGLPVGLIPGTEYSQTVVTLQPSDLLMLYTDGITEAGNETGQELGREQLLEWARRAPVESPRALGEDLLQRLELFRGKIRNDDQTLLVLQREEESRLLMLGEVANSYTFGRLLRSKKRKSATNQQQDASTPSPKNS